MGSTSFRNRLIREIEGQFSRKNYILNAYAAKNVLGFNSYADAAGSAPVDATGGAANITWTRTTSTPLSGDGSFLFTKDAANRQGQGESYDITIDSCDQGKVMKIVQDYAIASGTYADGDLTMYVYDITNAVVIQTTNYKILNAATGLPERHVTQFQAATNSTSYRIAWHVASTSAVAYTVKFDNIYVTSADVGQGPAITDYISYTPTGSWTTNTTYTGKWKRVGDEMVGHVVVTLSGAPNNAALTVNLPSGYSIDTTKFNGNQDAVGYADLQDSGVQAYPGLVLYNNTTSVKVQAIETDTTYGQNISLSTTVPFTWGNTDFVVLHFTVPIVGWSSNVAMSSDTDQRVVSFGAYRITSGQTVTAGTPLEVVPNASRHDTHGAFSTSTGRFTAPVAGKYKFTAGSQITMGATAAADITLYFLKNGTGSKLGIWFLNSLANSKVYTATCSIEIDLLANDYVSVWAESTTQNVTVGNTGATNDVTYFYGDREAGPAQIGATEVITASYGRSANQTLSANDYVNWDQKFWDSHNAVTTGTGTSWKYTVPAPGYYRVTCGIQATAATGADVDVMLDDVLERRINSILAAGNGTSGSALIKANAGQKIAIRLDAATTVSAGGTNRISFFDIIRVGTF